MIQLNVYSSLHSIAIQSYLFFSTDLGREERRKGEKERGGREKIKKNLSSRGFLSHRNYWFYVAKMVPCFIQHFSESGLPCNILDVLCPLTMLILRFAHGCILGGLFIHVQFSDGPRNMLTGLRVFLLRKCQQTMSIIQNLWTLNSKRSMLNLECDI